MIEAIGRGKPAPTWSYLFFQVLMDFVVVAITLAPEGRNIYSNAVWLSF